MVAQTDIKYYVHTNHKAPQLENAYGSMLGVLDACLVNGFGSQTVDSLTANGKTVTADFGKAHNLLRFQVIKIDGAIQDEFNGEHRILDVTTNAITFEIATPATAQRASGLINCSLPPLGWEKPFASVNPTGGGKGAYRSKNTLLPNRPFLRVVDELDPSYNADWTKFAKVGMVEDMLDIDTMIGQQVPFTIDNPQKNWVGNNDVNGWSKWYYATGSSNSSSFIEAMVAQNGNRDWVIIGCQDWFYLFNSYNSNNEYKRLLAPCFFGYLSNDYYMSHALMSINQEFTVRSYTQQCNHAFFDMGYKNILFNRSHGDNYVLGYTLNLQSGVSNHIPEVSSNVPVFSNTFHLRDIHNIPRGELPAIEYLYQKMPYPDMYTFSENNRAKVAVPINAHYYYQGQVLFDLGDL